MSKLLVFTIAMVLSLHALADDKVSPLKMIGANKGEITIETEDKEGVQAAMYADSEGIAAMIEIMEANPKSSIAKAKAALLKAECDQESEDTCGYVSFTQPVEISFGRGGWMGGSAGYLVFVKYTERGTGRFTDAKLTLEFNVDASAKTNKDGEYAGIVKKTISLRKVKVFKR